MCGALESFKTDQLSVQLTFLHICTLLTGLLQRFMTGTADVQMKQLQSVQSMAAGLVSGARQCEHIMPILHTHHYQRDSELLLRLMSLFGSASTALHEHIYKSCAFRWTVSKVFQS